MGTTPYLLLRNSKVTTNNYLSLTLMRVKLVVVVMLHRACLPLAPQYIANLFMEPDMAPVRPSASIIITCDRQQTTLASVTSGGEDIMSRCHR